MRRDGITYWRGGPADSDRYTRGQCHALALALHQRTGYDLVGIRWTDYDYQIPLPGHVAVICPDGYLLDIDGRVHCTDISDWVVITAGQVASFSDDTLAWRYAPPLLDEHTFDTADRLLTMHGISPACSECGAEPCAREFSDCFDVGLDDGRVME